MDAGAGPLGALKQHFDTVDQIQVSGEKGSRMVQFPNGTRCSAGIETAYRTGKGKGQFLTLGTLVFFLRHKNLVTRSYGRYVGAALKEGYPRVPRPNVKDLLDYLSGKIDSSEYVDAVALISNRARGEHKGEAHGDTKTEPKPLGYSILRMERKITDRNSMLCHPFISFDKVLSTYKRVEKEIGKDERSKKRGSDRKDSHKHSDRHAKHTKRAKMSRMQRPRDYDLPPFKNYAMIDNRQCRLPKTSCLLNKTAMFPHPKSTPIIIVPKANTALVNMWNVKLFLQNKRYSTYVDQRRKMKGKKPPMERLRRESHNKPGKTAIYAVTDEPKKLSLDDWKRVVAVISTGAKWELEAIPLSNPAEIFARFRGVHFYKEGEALKSTVQVWNVQKLSISMSSRHKDAELFVEFWQGLLEFIGAAHRFRHLLY